jgi:cobalt-zinc-cadmium efflux system protein
MTGHHHHHHDHTVDATGFNRAFIFAILANSLFVIGQVIFAYRAHSTSLFADAMHNLGDVLGLSLSWVAQGLLKKTPTRRATYGKKKFSILASLANGVLLVFTCGMIASEAIYKLFSPTVVDTNAVMIVAGLGIVVNGLTAIPFWRGSHDLNIRSAFLHLVSDALISVGVVLSAALLAWTGYLWIDPLMGLVIALIILKGTWSLFTGSLRLIADGVPDHIILNDVRTLLAQLPRVSGVHDLHVWALSTQENALSVHLWMPEAPLSDEERIILAQRLHDEHHIHHVTIQVERSEGSCVDSCTSYF